MNSDVLIGNLCSAGAMITDSVSSTRKKRNEILAIQIFSQGFYAIATIILKGYSSTAQNVVAIIRNLAAIKNVQHKAIEWFLIALGVILGVLWNNLGLLGWLPILANLEYSIAMFRVKEDERKLKIAFLIYIILYGVFSVLIKNYVGAAANAVVAVTTVIALTGRTGKNQNGASR